MAADEIYLDLQETPSGVKVEEYHIHDGETFKKDDIRYFPNKEPAIKYARNTVHKICKDPSRTTAAFVVNLEESVEEARQRFYDRGGGSQ